ncbi:carboxylesterase family protein [Catenuloplanes nepalensis]|uniref:carboxylesterase family protein n=1 Tax=Catenuloplanes nepalensis TaxID=587533 RepID=UPI0027D85B5B|nr:carboxylesterase family protein [Catenuloplanes nepalensis]
MVRTDRGRVRGRDGVFKGIPFAAPPAGDLRFQPPEPVVSWEGVRDALEFGPAVPQPSPAPGVPSCFDPARGDDADAVRLVAGWARPYGCRRWSGFTAAGGGAAGRGCRSTTAPRSRRTAWWW